MYNCLIDVGGWDDETVIGMTFGNANKDTRLTLLVVLLWYLYYKLGMAFSPCFSVSFFDFEQVTVCCDTKYCVNVTTSTNVLRFH